MTCCLCLATIPFCEALFSEDGGVIRRTRSSSQDGYMLVEEKLDDGDDGISFHHHPERHHHGNSDNRRPHCSHDNNESDDVSSTAFTWTPKAPLTPSSSASLMVLAPDDDDAPVHHHPHQGEEKVDFFEGASYPERFNNARLGGGGLAGSAEHNKMMQTISNQSLDWSLLTTSPNNDRSLILDDDDPYLVYEMDFTTEKIDGTTAGRSYSHPFPPPPLPPSSPPASVPTSPDSSPRSVRMIPLPEEEDAGPYDVDTVTKVRRASHATLTTATRSWTSPTLSSPEDARLYHHHHHPRNRDVQVAIRSATAAECVDLVFVIDATGSMLKHIQNVKKSIRTIITKCRKTHSNLRLRLAAVAYRDLSDAVPYEVLDFCSSVERFEQFLGSLRAVGGADMPEDMATGIRMANRLSWAHPTRLVFVVADAPCHGIEFHNFDDDYPMGTPGIRIVNELQQLLKNVGDCTSPNDMSNNNNSKDGSSMSLYFGRISTTTDEMLRRWRGHYGIDVNVVPFTDAAKVTTAVTKAIRSAIFSTLTATRRLQQHTQPQHLVDTCHRASRGCAIQQPGVRPKNFPIIPREPTSEEWKKRPVQAVNVFRNNPIQSMEDLFSPLRVSMLKIKTPQSSSQLSSSIFSFAKASAPASEAHMLMRRAALPFAEGEIRVAFHGHLARTAQEFQAYDASSNSKVDHRFASMATVLKTLKHHGPGLNSRQQYLMQMEMSTIAGYLAELYNRTRRNDLAPIHVLNVLVVEEVSAQNEKAGNRRFCAESPLPKSAGCSAFTKYSSNAGYWNMDSFDESLLRFTEFTYHVTDKYLLVTDLQGVKARNGHYYLTDPVILCQDLGRFGTTNLGGAFMEKCLASTRSLLEERGRYLV